MYTKQKQIIESIVVSNENAVKEHLEYLKSTMSIDEKISLYQHLSEVYCSLTKHLVHKDIKKNSESESIEDHLRAKEENEATLQIASKIELALSIIQPIDDHSIRGAAYFSKKLLNPS